MAGFFKGALIGVFLAAGALPGTAVTAGAGEVDTVGGVKSIIENAILEPLGPIGDVVSILQNSSDTVKAGLLVWLRKKMADALVNDDDDALDKYTAFYVCLGTGACDAVRAVQGAAEGNSAPASTASAGSFKIYEAFLPHTILSGGRKGNLTVYMGGSPRFPVTMIYRPTPHGCPKGVSCSTEEVSFSSNTDPLIAEGIVWCAGLPHSVYFGYEVLLRDADGNETAPKPAGVNCQATGN